MTIFAPLKVVQLMYVVCIWISAVRSDVMMDLVQEQNISIEKYTVITLDGYILALYHIPPKNKEINDKTKVILLLHGLFSISSQYIIYPKESAGYVFHNLGYDVWFGNFRGTTLSRSHTNLNPDENEFWRFSFHEMGTIDTPAFIDYILKYTKKEKLILYGHSIGGTNALACLSDVPEYNDKVSSIHLIAVSGLGKSTKSTFKLLAPGSHNFAEITEENDLQEWLPNWKFGKVMNSLGHFCMSPFSTFVCKSLIESNFGLFTKNGYSKTLMMDSARYGFPAGVSARTYLHISQCFAYGSFRKYDFGTIENLRLYGTERPPVYNLSNIRTNVQLMYGKRDILALDSDARYLIENMKNAKQIRRDDRDFNHFEFLIPPYVKGVNELVDETIKKFGD